MQVKVTNGGSGNPGPMTQFPGAYSDTDEYANFSIYNGFKDFPMPGPEVWSGGGGGNNAGNNDGNNGGNSAPPAEFNQEIPQPSRSDENPESDNAPEFGQSPEFGDAPAEEEDEPCTANRRRARRSRRAARVA